MTKTELIQMLQINLGALRQLIFNVEKINEQSKIAYEARTPDSYGESEYHKDVKEQQRENIRMTLEDCLEQYNVEIRQAFSSAGITEQNMLDKVAKISDINFSVFKMRRANLVDIADLITEHEALIESVENLK